MAVHSVGDPREGRQSLQGQETRTEASLASGRLERVEDASYVQTIEQFRAIISGKSFRGKTWAPEEDARLKELWPESQREGWQQVWPRIASMMPGRGQSACSNRLYRIRLKASGWQGAPKTEGLSPRPEVAQQNPLLPAETILKHPVGAPAEEAAIPPQSISRPTNCESIPPGSRGSDLLAFWNSSPR
jgi:hypothetical protein